MTHTAAWLWILKAMVFYQVPPPPPRGGEWGEAGWGYPFVVLSRPGHASTHGIPVDNVTRQPIFPALPRGNSSSTTCFGASLRMVWQEKTHDGWQIVGESPMSLSRIFETIRTAWKYDQFTSNHARPKWSPASSTHRHIGYISPAETYNFCDICMFFLKIGLFIAQKRSATFQSIA